MLARRLRRRPNIDPALVHVSNARFHKISRPADRYSNKAESANQDIYDDFKLKNLGLHGLYKILSAL